MKVQIVSACYYPVLGGAEIHIQKLAEGLARNGHTVTVLTSDAMNAWAVRTQSRTGLPNEEVLNGVLIKRGDPTGGYVGTTVRRLLALPGGWRTASLLFGQDGVELLTQKPFLSAVVPSLVFSPADVVISSFWEWPTVYHVYLARRIRRFRHVGIPGFHLTQAWPHQPIIKRMLKHCDCLITSTSFEAEFVQREAHVPTAVGGLGIDPAAFNGANGHVIRQRYGLGDRPVVGFVGRLTELKGPGTVIRAMHLVWQWNPDVRLVLAGAKQPDTPAVAAALASLSLAETERIAWITDFNDDEKGSIFDAFDVFVLPSIAESFGIAYLEAWMCRKPVIGGRIGSTACVIDEGVDGFLVDPSNPDEVAKRIIELLGDPQKRSRMGAIGRAKTLETYTWDKVTERVERACLDLLAPVVAGNNH